MRRQAITYLEHICQKHAPLSQALYEDLLRLKQYILLETNYNRQPLKECTKSLRSLKSVHKQTKQVKESNTNKENVNENIPKCSLLKTRSVLKLSRTKEKINKVAYIMEKSPQNYSPKRMDSPKRLSPSATPKPKIALFSKQPSLKIKLRHKQDGEKIRDCVKTVCEIMQSNDQIILSMQ